MGTTREHTMRTGRSGGWGVGLTLLLALLASCHEPGQTRGVRATAVVDPEEVDFGEVPVGVWRERPVRVRNVGYVPFHALDALGLRGNPSYEVLFEDGRVLPGEEKVVRVRFHPLEEGPHEEAVRVRTDANTGSEFTVRVLGQGTPAPIQVYPERLDFETLEVESERTLGLTITNPVDLPLTVRVTGPGAGTLTTDALTLPPYSTREVRTRYLPREPGDLAAQVEVRACPSCTPTVTPLSGRSVPSAFTFEPEPVPFEAIPVHERTRSRSRARNITWRPVSITGLSTSDHAFTPLRALEGVEVGPGEAVEVPLEFAARYAGPNMGMLTVGYTSDRPRQSEVMLDARGGRPTLAVAPLTLDFGELPVGGKVGQVIRISNGGTHGALHFLTARGAGDWAHFSVGLPEHGGQPVPWRAGAWPTLETDIAIAPGEDAVELHVYFEPKAPGPWQASLVLGSDDLFNPERTLLLTGRARATGTCTFELKPQPVMEFGNVPPGHGAVLGFRFANPSSAECVVKDIHISQDGGGAFFMPGGALAGGVVPYDSAFSAMVAFRPPATGEFHGELRMTVNDPAQPTVTLPLHGVSQASCLVATPPFVDFGPIRYDCAPVPRRTLVSNQCPMPITVTNVQIGAGTSDQYTLETPLSGPVHLQPGEGFELELSYARNVLGQHYSPLYVQADSEPPPLLVPLLAETNHEGLQVDRFIQGTDSQLDVLFVVSNTTTMGPFQQKLRAALPGWLERARQAGVDLRVGFTTTGLTERAPLCQGPAAGGEAGRLVPLDGSLSRVVSSTSPGAGTTAQSLLDTVGRCHHLVQGLETLRQALSAPLATLADDPRTPQPEDGNLGFLRSTASLAGVVLSDEDDHSGFEPESYVQFLRTLKGTGMAHRTQLHALVPTDNRCTTAGQPGPRFATVARRTGGQVDSICLGNYGPFLDTLLERAGQPQTEFLLSAQPNGPEEMSVRLQGQPVPDTQWSYDAARNAIVFPPAAAPKPGQTLEVRYRSVCLEPAPPP